jgi:glyoxylase-like metal-dependent hydrolase (beta-lactamase superfamily II)
MTECQSSGMDQQRSAGGTVDGVPPPAFSQGPWREVAPGVHVCVAEPDSVNLGLVVGSTGALLVDTGSSPEQGEAVRASVAGLTDRPLVGVVVTHAHRDHALGLPAFVDLVTFGHESLVDALVTPPSRALAVAAALDLGERRVEIAHLGPGHTAGDLLVVVPDADLLFVGDLVESAGPPWFGPDSLPHAWAATLDGVIGLMTATTRAVPGHGDLVDREFVFDARGLTAAVSGELVRLVESGVAEADALAAGSWPYPAEHVAAGVAPGYAALAGRGVKGTRPTLPLA